MLSAKRTNGTRDSSLRSGEPHLHQIYVRFGMKDLYKQAFIRVMKRYYEQKSAEEAAGREQSEES